MSRLSAGGVNVSFSPTMNQRRTVDVRQQRRRVASGHQRRDGARNRFRRVGQHESPHTLDDLGLCPDRLRREQLRHHLVGHSRRPLLSEQGEHPRATLLRLWSIGLRAGIGEHHAAEVAGGVPEQGKCHVAAHREPADDRFVDVQRVQQINHLPGRIVERGDRRFAGSAVHARQLRCDDAPSALGERELRLPHARVQREGMEQHERAKRPHAGLRGGFKVAQSVLGIADIIALAGGAPLRSTCARRCLRPAAARPSRLSARYGATRRSACAMSRAPHSRDSRAAPLARASAVRAGAGRALFVRSWRGESSC